MHIGLSLSRVCEMQFRSLYSSADAVDGSQTHIKVKLKRDRFETRQCLANAWNVLLDDEEENIRTNDVRLMNLFAYIKPNNTKDENMELIEMLDADNDGIIENFDWTTMLLDVLQIDFYDTNRTSELEPEWKIFGSWSTLIKDNHSLFKRIIIGEDHNYKYQPEIPSERPRFFQ